MFKFIRSWLDRRLIQGASITATQWEQAYESLPLLNGISVNEKHTLQELTILFLHRKAFEGAHGLTVTQPMSLIIALQACLPILKLGLERYDGWISIIVYPSGFAPKRVITDEYGVVHHVQSNLSGESWQRGPVVLSWDETKQAGIIDGHNLVIHEFAHKLDMQNGQANGYPPLHANMDSTAWVNIFSAGFEDFQHKCNRGTSLGIDCYAATSPAEYFAVLSEVFFERPDIIHHNYPEIHELLRQYYRQDPLMRLT